MAPAIRGYFAALAAGNLVFWIAGAIGAAVSGTIGENASIVGFLIVALFTFIVSLVTTVFPFILFFAIARIMGVRGWPYFALCGTAMGLLTTALVIGGRWTDAHMWALNASLWQQLSVSGAVGGLVFWWTSVRNRGAAAPDRSGLNGTP